MSGWSSLPQVRLCALILTVNAGVAIFAWSPPESRPTVDWLNDPFIGPGQISAWLAPIDGSPTFGGRVRAHRVWVGLTACAAAALSLYGLVSRPSTASRIPMLAGSASVADIRRWRPSGVACVVLMVGIAAVTCVNNGRTPDFRSFDEEQMHVAICHYELLAAADHVSAGDRLFVDVEPAYGLAWPLVMGAYQKAFGLVSLGAIVKILINTNAAFMLLFIWLCYRWARGRLASWVPPLVLVCGYYLTINKFLVPPNHCLIRSGALAASPGIWLTAMRMGPVGGPFLIGLFSVLAMAMNWEAGVAASVGSLVAGWFGWFLPTIRPEPMRAFGAVAASLCGAIFAVIAIESFAFLTLGQLIPASRIILPSTYAAASSGAFLTYAPQPWVIPLMIVMLVHAAATLLHVATLPERGVRHAVRAAISTALLIWMAYPVNRPHSAYLYAAYLLYGFLVVDVSRALAATWKSRGSKAFPIPAVATALTAGVFVLPWWGLHGDVWRGGGDRWQADLASCGPSCDCLSDALVDEQFAQETLMRAAFIARKVTETGRRAVYVSNDAYVISRVADSVPLQPASEPAMCITKKAYEDFLENMIEKASGEFYIDTRAKTGGTWYSFVNDMARRDLSEQCALVGEEDGWEIWRLSSNASPECGRRTSVERQSDEQ